MPKYVMLAKMNQKGKDIAYADGSEISRIINETERRSGCTIDHTYVALGRFDYIIVIDAEENNHAARTSLHLANRAVLDIETIPLLDLNDETGAQTDPKETAPVREPNPSRPPEREGSATAETPGQPQQAEAVSGRRQRGRNRS